MSTTTSDQEISRRKKMQDDRDMPAWATLLTSIQKLWQYRNPEKPKLEAFISYAWEDTSTEEGKIANSTLQNYLESLRDDLQEAGISTFLDISCTNGDIEKIIKDNLKASDIIITIHTPRFKARAEAIPKTYLGSEYELTLKKAQTIPNGIFPLLYAGDLNEAVPIGLRGYLVRDCTNPATYSNNLVATQRPLGIIPAIYSIKCDEDKEYQSLIHQWQNKSLNKLPASNPYFVGREDLLIQIEKLLEQGTDMIYQRQTISGLGGVGKSELALAYAYRQGDKYEMKRRLDVGESNIKIEFGQLASELGIEHIGMDDTELANTVYRRIGQINTWLLIFDNADNYEAVKAYLPKSLQPGQHILITSRSQHWKQGIPIDCFSEADAASYIIKNLSHVSQEDAILLAKELGYLPLALSLAVSYISGISVRPIQAYIELYKNKGIELFEVKGHSVQGDSYPHNVLTTWALSMEKIKQDAPEAAKMLEMCSYLGPNNIPLALLESKSLLRNALVVNESIRVLRNYSLVEAGSIDDHIQMHRLVQAVTKHRYEKATNKQAIAELLVQISEALVKYYPEQKLNKADFEKVRLLLPHLRALIDSLDGYACVVAEGVVNKAVVAQNILLGVTANALMALGDYAEAKELFQKSLVIAEKIYNKDDILVAAFLNDLGNAFYSLKEHKQAKDSYKRALMIYENLYGQSSIELAGILNNLGLVLIDLRDHHGAKKLLKKALAILEKEHGSTHIELAATLNNLSLVLVDLKECQEAEELCKRALMIEESYYEKGHRQIAKTLHNLGKALFSLEKYDKARELYEEALRITEENYDKYHIEVVSILNNLSPTLIVLRNYPEAKEICKRALEICKKKHLEEHIMTATALENLGNTLYVLKEYEEAKKLLEESIGIKRKHYGNADPDVAKTLNNLGKVFYCLKDYQKAKELYEEALRIMENHYGKNHPDLAIILYNLSAIYNLPVPILSWFLSFKKTFVRLFRSKR